MKYIILKSKYNKSMGSFLTYQFESHEEKTSKKFPDSIFWVKDGKVIAEIENSKRFWVLPSVWSSISVMLSMDYDKTQQIIDEWLEEHYKLGGLIPSVFEVYHRKWVGGRL